jgi:hypothetical protein
MEWIVLLIALFLVFVVLFVDAVLRKKKSLPLSVQRDVVQKWEKIENISDVHRQILEVDKLLDFILGKKGYQGTYADKLKTVQKTEKIDTEQLWYIHKKRNQIAHEVDVTITKEDQKKILIYGRESLRRLGINI